jgi:hypothetical protein
MVREIMKEGFAGGLKKEDRKAFDKMRRKQSEVLGYTLTGTDDLKAEIDDATIKEAKKRDYKAEYKKYGSSTKSKKYRAELNKYNRQKGTYGNGDGKDASHKGGKIVGFEKESVNRGRAEKSRLKKEGKLTEAETMKLSDVWKDYVKKYGKNKAAEKLMDILTMGAWASWDGDRIKRFKKEIIKKFSKFMKEGKLTEISNKVIQNLKDTSGKMWDYYYQEKPAYVQPFNEPRGEKIKVKDIKDKKLKVKIKQLDKILREGKLKEGINVRKWIKAVDKGKDVVVYDKKGKRYTFQGGDNKYVSVTDHWKDGGDESSWKDIRHKDIKKIVIEGKLNEGKVVTLPNGIKVKIDFKGLTFMGSKGKPVFLDRAEMMTFFKATARYLK